MTYIVITGDILSGHNFYGPFPDYWTAIAWADGLDNEYSVTSMEAPDA